MASGGMASGIADVAKWADTVAARRSSKDADHRAPRRELIISAAAACIEEHGGGVGTSQIAEYAGVPRPHVYRYFDSKDDLDDQVARYAANELVASVRPSMARTGTPVEIVHGVISETVGWARAHPHLYRFMAVRQESKVSHGAKLSRTRYFAEVMTASAAYLQASRIDLTAPDGVMAGLIGMVDASIIWWLEHDDEPQGTVVDRLTRQAWLVLRDALEQLGLPVDEGTVLSLED